jgi:hypothetical protein
VTGGGLAGLAGRRAEMEALPLQQLSASPRRRPARSAPAIAAARGGLARFPAVTGATRPAHRANPPCRARAGSGGKVVRGDG